MQLNALQKAGCEKVFEGRGPQRLAGSIRPSVRATGGRIRAWIFYFEAQKLPASKIYLTGIKDTATGKDYFYFEVPME